MSVGQVRGPEDIPIIHEFKNHLSIVVGYCELLLQERLDDHPARADLLEMRKAAEAALALLPELSLRLK